MVAPRSPLMPSFVEVLEARIAPAVIINVGAPVDGPGNTTYNEAPFVRASASSDPGIAALFAGQDDYFVLTLGAGDKVKMWNSGGQPFDYLTVSAGKAVAFFHNKDASAEAATPTLLDDGRVDKGDLVGLSLGRGVRISVGGASVDGDVIANFNSLTGLVSVDSLVPGNTIAELNVSGGVNGRIIAPGNISKVNIGVAVEQITTLSDGTYRYDFGGSGTSGPGEALLAAYSPESGKAGGNIGNGAAGSVTVGSLDKIVGGSGGAGGAGGSISGVTVKSDYNGFEILAGAGGSGSRGGAGGLVSKVLVVGFESSSATVPVSGEILISGGVGGAASAGAGGSGGAVSNIFIGYSQLSAKSVSPLPLAYFVSIEGGDGGAGTSSGGRGGSLSGINVYTSVDGDISRDEIRLLAGDGGAASSANGRGGLGGSVTKVLAVNLNDSPTLSDNVFIRAGDAGAGAGTGASGGAVTSATVLAERVQIFAGAGSAGGSTGGAGGNVGAVTLSFSDSDRLEIVEIAGGSGGQGGTGAGGRGGSVDRVTGLSLDFSNDVLPMNSSVLAGAGGSSLQGVGGRGGSLTTISLFETFRDRIASGTHESINFQAGAGGDGFKGGGVGGAITGLTFFGYNTLPTVTSGHGGNATGQGPGGAGGALGKIAVQAFNLNAARPGDRTVVLQAGQGGTAAGPSAAGGAGGSVSSATVLASIGSGNFAPGHAVDANIHVLAGRGGAAGSGGVGGGGSVTGVVASTASGDAKIAAGSAGPVGAATRAAAGGSLTNVSASASGDVVLLGGDGRLGGSGGRIDRVAWFGIDPVSNVPDDRISPTGSVEIRAGQGSIGVGTTAKAGAGGALSRLSGHAGDTGTALIYAGDGNGGVAGARAAAGGSISNLNLFGGLASVDLRAGNGGSLSAGAAGSGGGGGSVSGVSAFSGVNVQTVAAGGGGDAGLANGRGGNGGSVSALNVFGDIGKRTGANFGIDGMGGIFAGAGGLTAGPDANFNGKAGQVTNVTAAAISSIVAGRPTTALPENFQLVSLVDRVALRGLTMPAVSPDGAYANFATANVVGGVASDPSAAGANVFKTTTGAVSSNPYPWELGTTKPLDGLVAAVTLGDNNRNFVPQALLRPVPAAVSPTGFALLDDRNDFRLNSLTGTSS